MNQNGSTNAPAYQIRVRGHLDPNWSEWFGGWTIAHLPEGETLISGTLPDQAALHGLLNRIRDLGIVLISVSPVDVEAP